jgi:hypothetical protein
MNANPLPPRGPALTPPGRTTPPAPPEATAPRFDARFIAQHHLIERYLDNKLPPKGARELENWCRANPAYLDGLRLSERAAGSLKLLEACGRPLDLSEAKPAWWKSSYVAAGLTAVAVASLLGLWALSGKFALLRGELEEARLRLRQGALQPPTTQHAVYVAPDRVPGADRARIEVNRGVPQLIDLHVDLGYTKELQQYRLIVDKQGQGRALILNDLLRDSNGELRLTFNTTGLAAGIYPVRIESLPAHASGAPMPVGWLILEVR